MIYEIDNTAHCPVFKTPKQYAEEKIKILEKDFYINPTDAEKLHLKTLKTQIAIDNAVLSIINRYWG